jgi:hypothetical protein
MCLFEKRKGTAGKGRMGGKRDGRKVKSGKGKKEIEAPEKGKQEREMAGKGTGKEYVGKVM